MENEVEEEKCWSQILAVCCACIGAFLVGLNFAWPSPCLPIIIEQLNINNRKGSYITISSPFGNMVASALSLYLTHKLGRKITILLIAVPHIISWCVITYSKTTFHYIIGRMVAGFSESFCFIAIPVYIGEIASPKIKEKMNCLTPIFIICGNLFVNSIGTFMEVANTSSTCQMFPFLLIVIFVWFPESPYFLVKKNKLNAATKSLKFYRRKKNVESDLNFIIEDIQKQSNEPSTIKQLFTIQTNRQALLIMFILRFTQLFSGYPATIIYTYAIFTRAETNIAVELSVFIYIILHLTFTICGIFLVDIFKRKPILLISFIGSFVFQVLEAIYFYLIELGNVNMKPYSWVAVVGMSGYTCFYSIGLNIIPTLMLGDLFSNSIKSKAMCLLNIHQGALFFSISKSFQETTDYFGEHAAFTLYAVVAFIGTIFTHFCVPETKGKSFEDIQMILQHTQYRFTLLPSDRY